MKIINLTPHDVNIITGEGTPIREFKSMGEARCEQSTVTVGELASIPLTGTEFGEVIDLPTEEKDTYYIVSRLVRQACPDRNDLLVPNEIVRDEAGQIIGCKSFAVN